MKKIIIIFVLFTLLFSKQIFSTESYKYSRLEVDKNLHRRKYLGEGLGIIYKNKFGLGLFNYIYPGLMKTESVLFSGLDNPILFVTLYGTLIYFGLKKQDEK